jgi:hypothetical protein
MPSVALRSGPSSLVVTLLSAPGQEPVALQWKIRLGTEVTAEVKDIVVGAGAAKANKAVTCAPAAKPAADGLVYNCILAGGVQPIANGPVFLVNYRLKETAAPQTLVVRVSDAMAVLQRLDHVRKTDIAPAEGTITIR